METILDQLAARGLLYQSTDLEALQHHLAKPCTIYCGFDPTAPSLTIGNLVPLMVLAHFQQHGHTPVIVMGGATGLIGDPSGKSTERPLLSPEVVAANVQSQRRLYETCLDFDPHRSNAAVIQNNAEWLSRLSFVDALRDLGKYFSINQMLQRDAIRERLTKREQGISYTEFSYGLLQAYDFQYLFEHQQVTIQLGGSDQWGNIVAGVDLVRRVHNRQVYGITCPLVTKADGGKFGKTEAGPIWLTAERTSPYQLYQFLLNTADEDVHRYLRLFTLLSLAAIDTLMAQHIADPGQRVAQHALAHEVTSRVHGASAAADAETAAQALFSGDLTGCSLHALTEALAGAPTTHHRLDALWEPGLPVVELLCAAAVCASKRQARELLAAGAILLNGHQATLDERLTVAQLLHGRLAALRRGKKAWYVTLWD